MSEIAASAQCTDDLTQMAGLCAVAPPDTPHPL
jgi:hypothetical protein